MSAPSKSILASISIAARGSVVSIVACASCWQWRDRISRNSALWPYLSHMRYVMRAARVEHARERDAMNVCTMCVSLLSYGGCAASMCLYVYVHVCVSTGGVYVLRWHPRAR